MPDAVTCPTISERFPSWVPKEAFTYLAHTEQGVPLRELAREAGVHASTVLRQVRAVEARREDHLVDHALNRLGKRVTGEGGRAKAPGFRTVRATEQPGAADAEDTGQGILSETRLRAEAKRVLPKLCETGAVLAVAADMDKAVIVRETGGGDADRRAVVDRDVAEALALKQWIRCDKAGRIARYVISSEGHAALRRLLADDENRAVGLADHPQDISAFRRPADATATARADRAPRSLPVETPLVLLSRRRDRRGQKFLPSELVSAGERLREDFERAGLRPRIEEGWDQFLSSAQDLAAQADASEGAIASRQRVIGALRDLGPGLGDIVLRCCCYLEGLESTERRMGWSARSGKVVLRIALQRLKRHYDQLGEAGALMG